MESMSLEQREVILDTLELIRDAIKNLFSWNEHVIDMKTAPRNQQQEECI